MNNSMIISDKINKTIIQDYEKKLFEMYEKIYIEKSKVFKDNGFKLVLMKQRYDSKTNRWYNDQDKEFNSIEYDNGYKSLVTIALYKDCKVYTLNNKKIMNNYFVVDMMLRTNLDNKWVIKYFTLNKDVYRDIESYFVLTTNV